MIRQSSTYMAIWEDGYIDIIRLKLLYRMNITVSFNGENVSSYQLQEHSSFIISFWIDSAQVNNIIGVQSWSWDILWYHLFIKPS